MRRITVRITHHGEAKLARIDAKCSAPRALRPNLETSARRTGRYTLFGLAGGNFREIGRFVWNLLAFARQGSVGRSWKVSSLPFFYSV